jgi:hypothetical protein
VKDQEVLAEFDDWMLDYQSRGITIEVLGEEQLAGTRVLKLKLTNKGRAVHSYLDAATYLEVRRDHLGAKGEPIDQTLVGEYADVGGIKMPLKMETTSLEKPLVSRMQFEKPEMNADIPDSRFAAPR